MFSISREEVAALFESSLTAILNVVSEIMTESQTPISVSRSLKEYEDNKSSLFTVNLSCWGVLGKSLLDHRAPRTSRQV